MLLLDVFSKIHNMRPDDLVWMQRDLWRAPPDICNLLENVRSYQTDFTRSTIKPKAVNKSQVSLILAWQSSKLSP